MTSTPLWLVPKISDASHSSERCVHVVFDNQSICGIKPRHGWLPPKEVDKPQKWDICRKCLRWA